MEKTLSIVVGWILILNLIYIIHMSFAKRSYYENLFATICVYFLALIEKPIIYGIYFSDKYGLSVVELIYAIVVLLFIIRYILSNNAIVIFNTNWKSFCKCAIKILENHNIQSTCSKASVHIDNGFSEISLLYTTSYRGIILVHFSNMRKILEKINFKEEMSEMLEASNLVSKRARYAYVVINGLFTIALLIHIRISM